MAGMKDVMIKTIFTFIVYYYLQSFTEGSLLIYSEPFVTALCCVRLYIINS